MKPAVSAASWQQLRQEQSTEAAQHLSIAQARIKKIRALSRWPQGPATRPQAPVKMGCTHQW